MWERVPEARCQNEEKPAFPPADLHKMVARTAGPSVLALWDEQTHVGGNDSLGPEPFRTLISDMKQTVQPAP